MSIASDELLPLAERLTRLPPSLTVDEYHRAVYSGLLHEDDPVELIEGRLVLRQPIGSRHAGTVTRLTRLLTRAAGDLAVVWVGNPVRLSERSEPQPDLMLLKPRSDDYEQSLPTPAEAYLLIEVADSTLRFDRNVKVPLYARDGIAEVWLVDLEHRKILVFTDPGASGYRVEREIDRGIVASGLLPQAQLHVEELFK
jgi:Uma2 family endonuclease